MDKTSSRAYGHFRNWKKWNQIKIKIKDMKLFVYNIFTETIRDFKEGEPLKKYSETDERFFF